MKILIYDEFNPEDCAMMQALYSRSPKSVTEHVEKVRQTGSGNFMQRYYVNYGHASIADCGSTTIFIENISMLADKAIQDWPLYSGQETSSRYIDMGSQAIIDPAGSVESKQIMDDWMNFYNSSQELVKLHLIEKYPKKPDEDEKLYLGAIKARAFDILRSFLPAGITTQLSWHTNLRQAWDKLALLKQHPLAETREIANTIHTKLKEKYASSFGHTESEEQIKYRNFLNKEYNYYSAKNPNIDFACKTNINRDELEKYKEVTDNRPLYTNLPHFLSELGNVIFDFKLDFGSFRDIQRHRNGVCRMPLLTTKLNFNSWYLNQLPNKLKQQALTLIKNQTKAIENLATSPEIKQYYIAMGFNVACRVSYGLPAAVYTTELRAGKMVHPTLRKVAHKMHYALLEEFPNLNLYSDLNLDDWDIRRGGQDIVEKHTTHNT